MSLINAKASSGKTRGFGEELSVQGATTEDDTLNQGKGQRSLPEPHPKERHLRLPNTVADALAWVVVIGIFAGRCSHGARLPFL